LLAGRCEYFRVLFASGMKESVSQQMSIEDFEPSVILGLLQWIYTDSVDDINLDVAVDLLQAANIYITDNKLKDLCSELVMKGF
jgi:hypothetical protein